MDFFFIFFFLIYGPEESRSRREMLSAKLGCLPHACMQVPPARHHLHVLRKPRTGFSPGSSALPVFLHRRRAVRTPTGPRAVCIVSTLSCWCCFRKSEEIWGSGVTTLHCLPPLQNKAIRLVSYRSSYQPYGKHCRLAGWDASPLSAMGHSSPSQRASPLLSIQTNCQALSSCPSTGLAVLRQA